MIKLSWMSLYSQRSSSMCVFYIDPDAMYICIVKQNHSTLSIQVNLRPLIWMCCDFPVIVIHVNCWIKKRWFAELAIYECAWGIIVFQTLQINLVSQWNFIWNGLYYFVILFPKEWKLNAWICHFILSTWSWSLIHCVFLFLKLLDGYQY